MKTITYRFSLDTHKAGAQKYLQGFIKGEVNARRLAITLIQNGQAVVIPDDGTVVAVMNTGAASHPCSIEDGNIIYDFQQADLVEAGVKRYQAEVILVSETGQEKILYSPSFEIEIADSDATIVGTPSEYTILEQAIAQAKLAYNKGLKDVAVEEDGTIVFTFNDDTEESFDALCYVISQEADREQRFGEMVQAEEQREQAEAQREQAEAQRGARIDGIESEIEGLDDRITYLEEHGAEEVPIATTEIAGRVKPDGKSIFVEEDGTIFAVGGGGGTEVIVSETEPSPEANWKLYIDPKEPIAVFDTGTHIDDDVVSGGSTWSSEKISPIKDDLEKLVKSERVPGVAEWVTQAIQIDPWNQLRDGATSTTSPNNISSKIAVKYGEKFLLTGADGSSSKTPFLVGITPEGTYTTVYYSGTPKTVHTDYEYIADGAFDYIVINSQANLSGIIVKKWEESEPVETTIIYAEMNPLRGKKLGVVGDSICAGNSYAGGYGKIIADNNGMTLQNLGVGGNSLTTNGSAVGADMDNLDWDNTQYYLKLGRNYTFTSPFISSTLCVPITRDIYYNGFGTYPVLYKYENGEMVAQPYVEVKPVGNFFIKLPLPNPDGTLVDVYWRTGYESDWSIFEDFHSGFSADTTYNKLYTVEKSIAAKAEDFDADCDYILFEGGVNDYLFDRWMGEITPNVASPIDTYTVLGAMEHLCRVMTRDYADKKVGFLFIHNAVNKNDKLSYRSREHKPGYGTLEERFEQMKKVLQKYSIPYCDLFNGSGFICEFDNIRTTYTGNGGDGIHPNKLGYDTFYVPKITSFLKSL